jgi:hypothetical protein
VKETDRQRIYKALIGPPPRAPLDDEMQKCIRESAAEDVKNVEPVIDEMLLAAIRETFRHGVTFKGDEQEAQCRCGRNVRRDSWMRHVEQSVLRSLN